MTTMLIVSIVAFMVIVILLLLSIACKPWRFFSSFFARPNRIPIEVDDLERPLVSDDVQIQDQNNDRIRHYATGKSCMQTENIFRSPRTEGLVHKQRLPPFSPSSTQGDSVVLDVTTNPQDDVLVGQTLKRHLVQDRIIHDRKEDASHSLPRVVENEKFQGYEPNNTPCQGSCLTLEVISGPSCGLHYSVQSANASKLPLTLGRVSPSDLVLRDSEVSGKHAMINWNLNRMKWELVDMGSLNGTLVNSHPINHPDTGSRRWGDPIDLASGDVITLGTTSKVSVQITSSTESQIPFRVGMASDAMALRQGGKKLPMEDVCYYQWPLHDISQFGLFGICDGHGGVEAAKVASKMLPGMVTSILSDSLKREKVLSDCDASDVLRDAFSQTEAGMDYYYEGCTATLLLVWVDRNRNFYAQCANVGDSACVIHLDGKQIKMTEDHRVTSHSERQRIQEIGEPLREGERRLCGLNLARMLGDKFLKQQDCRFSSEPYISQVVHIDQASRAFAVMASDGLWDVVSSKKAIELVLQTRDRCYIERENPAEKIANLLLREARSLRTKDNTTIIFLDFDIVNKSSCKVDP